MLLLRSNELFLNMYCKLQKDEKGAELEEVPTGENFTRGAKIKNWPSFPDRGCNKVPFSPEFSTCCVPVFMGVRCGVLQQEFSYDGAPVVI